MRLINKQVYLTLAECVNCGMNERTITDAKYKGRNSWDIIDDPEDARKILVGYEKLNEYNKHLVEQRFGNVYEQVAREPILALVVNDPKAVEFYKQWRYAGGVGKDSEVKYLPLGNTEKYTGGTVNKYVRAASWLNMLAGQDRETVRKGMGISLMAFYEQVGLLVAQEKENGKQPGYGGVDVLPGDFPGSHQRLMAKLAEYKKGGYECLINSRMGNVNSAKLGKVPVKEGQTSLFLTEVQPGNGVQTAPKSLNKRGAFDLELYNKQMAVMRRACSFGNNLNAGQVQKIVNRFFALNGWETLSVRSFNKFINENRDILTPGRKGKRAALNTVAMQVKRKRPAYPMVYVTLDGWTVELMYKGQNGDYNRLVVVVVLDAYNNYPLGYAIGDRETPELIKDACRNAVMHTAELFGQAYHPMQVQSDNYQIKNLTPFYQVMAGKYFTPAAVGNSKAKVVEPYFAYLNKEYCQVECLNWSGYNVDASKENQVNREWLNKIKNQFPDKKGVEKQIHDILRRERKAKRPEYLAKWAELPEQDRCPVSEMDYLKLFGQVLGGRTNRIAGVGIEKQINGEKRWYDTFDREFRRNMDIDWVLTGDPENLSKVLAESPDGKLRFILEEKKQVAMDFYSQTAEDADYRARVAKFNEEYVDEVTELYANDAEVVRELASQLPGLPSEEDGKKMQLMFTVNGQQKEGIQDAKRLGAAQRKLAAAVKKEEENADAAFRDEHMDFVTQGIDFNEYL